MDIVPELYEVVKETFKSKVTKDSFISEFLLKVQDGSVDFRDMQLYSKRLGKLLGSTFVEVIKQDVLPDGKLYWNIADRIIKPMLNQNHTLVNDAAYEVQKILDLKDGINLNPIIPSKPVERIKGLLDNVTVEGLDFSEVQKRMEEPTQNITESFFDDFIKENSEFKYQTGADPQIIRILMGKKPCKWCKNLAGTYEYSSVRKTGASVWQRHQKCHCQIIYKNNKENYLQGAHTKRILDDKETINARSLLNLDN